MKSLLNQLKEVLSGKDPIPFLDFGNQLNTFESNHYKLKNEHADLQEEYDQLKFEVQQVKQDDANWLVELSKKLAKTFKSGGADKMLAELTLHRAKIMDHFTMAYMAELNLKPSEVKLIQGINEQGYVEMYFEKNSLVLLP